ncbi:MAG: hypothetical protein AAGE98_08855 [Actinomycetota bacterium]
MNRPFLALAAATVALAACGADDDPEALEPVPTTTTTTAAASAPETDESTPGVPELHPDVVDAEAMQAADGTWRFDVTLSSPYDTPERYADAWRVLAPDGSVLGVRELAHDHQNEQPFTRSLSGVVIPDDLDRVVIEGRDQLSSWGGRTLELVLPR